MMRPSRERNINPLDLNNLPDDYSKHHLFHEDTSSSGTGGGGGYSNSIGNSGNRRKKSGGKEDGKVYECRFCSLKFCKSQALGGHMNRHRQERETETLNRARQLVFNNDTQATTTPHLSCQPMTAGGCYHPGAGEQTMSYRPLYSPRLFPNSSTAPVAPPAQPYPYPSPSRHISYPPPVNDYYVGHVVGSANHHYAPPDTAPASYTCIGAPVGHAADEGLSWGRTYGGGSTTQPQPQPQPQPRLFQDGF